MRKNKMKCRNCKHKLIGLNHQWYHTILGKRAYLPKGRICSCGCNKPEPTLIPSAGNKTKVQKVNK